MSGYRQDIAHQHVFQVFGLACCFAHGKDCSSRCHGISDTDEGFLRNVSAPGARKRKDRSAYEGERQTQPVCSLSVRVHSGEDRDRGAQRGNLRQGQIHKDDAALYDMHAQVSMYTRQDKTGHERPE